MTRPPWLTVLPDSTPMLTTALKRICGSVLPFTLYEGLPCRSELISRLQGHRIAINSETYYDEAVLNACPDLRSIIFLGTGASSYIDLKACAARGISVKTICNYGNRTVAEHTLGLLFAVYRDIGRQITSMRQGGWGGSPIGELYGKTLGVVGLGGIGREVTSLAKAIGMQVISWSRATKIDGVPNLPLVELLSQADAVSLHLSLTPETRGMFNEPLLRKMRRASVFINTARGGLVDERALISMLRDGHLAGAGLDVFESEPLPEGHPFCSLPTLILTSHTAWQSPEAIERLLRSALILARDEGERISATGAVCIQTSNSA